ncbi:MAG: hypothetical protein FJY67_07130 [Calditrichaeota bacterium]|nr:hypothetical protein [Calditrichota bacterium]
MSHLLLSIGWDIAGKRLAIRVLFMTIHPRLSRLESEPKRERPAEKPMAGRRGSWSLMRRHRMLVKRVVKRITRMTCRLLRAGRIDRVDGQITLATPDPFWTAVIYGALQPLRMLHQPPRRNVSIGADFVAETTRYRAAWQLSACPLRMLWIVFTTLAGMPWLALWRAVRDVSSGKSGHLHSGIIYF